MLFRDMNRSSPSFWCRQHLLAENGCLHQISGAILVKPPLLRSFTDTSSSASYPSSNRPIVRLSSAPQPLAKTSATLRAPPAAGVPEPLARAPRPAPVRSSSDGRRPPQSGASPAFRVQQEQRKVEVDPVDVGMGARGAGKHPLRARSGGLIKATAQAARALRRAVSPGRRPRRSERSPSDLWSRVRHAGFRANGRDGRPARRPAAVATA